MIKYYSADYILPVSTEPLKNGVVSVTETGEIDGLYESNDPGIKNFEVVKLRGIIVPGFINSHCHLELSHLFQQFPKGQGLLSFIRQIISRRDEAEEDSIVEAMDRADKAMWENGIVAVGDIVNKEISINVKAGSDIYYHSYVEIFNFLPEKATETFKAGLEIKERISPNAASIVPHAPYSVSKELLRCIGNFDEDGKNILTIHNQETEEENKFYRYKTGEFIDLYKDLNLDITFFKPQARNSIQSLLPLLPSNHRIMLVHNTYTSLKDIYFVRRFGKDITWCFCPNANLYIESRLPKIEMFLFSDFTITLGTDSLASNDGLCILSELKTLAKYFPSIPLTTTIRWATLNGARFLNIDHKYGSIERGKMPGLNLISNVEGLKLTADSKITKIV